MPLEQYMYAENRFKMLTLTKPEEAKRLLKEAQEDVHTRWAMYQYLAARQPEQTNRHNSHSHHSQDQG